MALTKAQKASVFEKVETLSKGSKSIAFVSFNKLKVADANALRRSLKSQGVGFVVAKKTIIRKALEKAGYTGTFPELTGEVGLAYGADLIAPAREVYEFQKKLKDIVTIIGGVFDGKFQNQNEMIQIASIPSQKTLYAMFANVINSPIQGLVMALDQIAQKKV